MIHFSSDSEWIVVFGDTVVVDSCVQFFSWFRFYFPHQKIRFWMPRLIELPIDDENFLLESYGDDKLESSLGAILVVFDIVSQDVLDHVLGRVSCCICFEGVSFFYKVTHKIPLYYTHDISGRMVSLFKWLGIANEALYPIKQSICPYFDKEDYVISNDQPLEAIEAKVFVSPSLEASLVSYIRDRCVHVDYIFWSQLSFLRQFIFSRGNFFIVGSDSWFYRFMTYIISFFSFVLPGSKRLFIVKSPFDFEQGLLS